MEVVDGVELTKQEATNVRLRRISDDGIMSLMRDARLRMENRRNCDDPGSQAIPAASGGTPSRCALSAEDVYDDGEANSTVVLAVYYSISNTTSVRIGGGENYW